MEGILVCEIEICVLEYEKISISRTQMAPFFDLLVDNVGKFKNSACLKRGRIDQLETH